MSWSVSRFGAYLKWLSLLHLGSAILLLFAVSIFSIFPSSTFTDQLAAWLKLLEKQDIRTILLLLLIIQIMPVIMWNSNALVPVDKIQIRKKIDSSDNLSVLSSTRRQIERNIENIRWVATFFVVLGFDVFLLVFLVLTAEAPGEVSAIGRFADALKTTTLLIPLWMLSFYRVPLVLKPYKRALMSELPDLPLSQIDQDSSQQVEGNNSGSLKGPFMFIAILSSFSAATMDTVNAGIQLSSIEGLKNIGLTILYVLLALGLFLWAIGLSSHLFNTLKSKKIGTASMLALSMTIGLVLSFLFYGLLLTILGNSPLQVVSEFVDLNLPATSILVALGGLFFLILMVALFQDEL